MNTVARATRELGIPLLRAAACLEPSDTRLAEIHRLAASVDEWDTLVHRAEHHGLAPLLYRNLKLAEVAIPVPVGSMLRALTLRHRLAHGIPTAVASRLTAGSGPRRGSWVRDIRLA